jgi:asparagine synthase (glutamine-hydrolysing)
MCGICGVIQIGGAPRPVIAPEMLDAMTDVMTHRGPDDRGTFMADGCAIGVRRLSIVDVTYGHQPFANETGEVIGAQNGELYEHDRLRAELRDEGHVFTTRCDTEILPHLYERHGPGFVSRLRGKYGLVVWDGRRRQAVIARDRLGIKPLYIARCGDLLVFGSELKSVLASGLVSDELDPEAIDAYLTLGFVPGPRTPLAGVQKLPPGHSLLVGDGAMEMTRYWELPSPDPVAAGEPELAEGLLDVLDESVRLRLMSDVPLGAMLSGGLDSSLIVALMARHMNQPVKTFAVGFAGPGNELADARDVASRLGADHHELELDPDGLDVDLADLAWYLDEPVADLSSLGFLALSQLAARHVSVALSGQGADELLGGYARHRAAAAAARVAAVPGGQTIAAALGRVAPGQVGRRAAIVGERDPAQRYMMIKSNLTPELRRRLATGPLVGIDGSWARSAASQAAAGGGRDMLEVLLRQDATLGLVDDMLHYFDRTSMAYSLEVRVPFLDHRVVEFCAGVPASSKVRGKETKHLLRMAARGLVPDHIIDKPKIGFFNGAVGSWLDRQMTALSGVLLDPGARVGELLDRRVVSELVATREPGDADLLLSILMLELWLSTYLPRARNPVAAGVAS